jgi:hypothetical protein
MRSIPVERLRKVWNNRRFTTFEVAAILMVSESELRRLARLHRLPHRHFVQANNAVNDEPEAEERAAQLQRMQECRDAHMRQRMGESECNTVSKVSKWRAGICAPREAHRIV